MRRRTCARLLALVVLGSAVPACSAGGPSTRALAQEPVLRPPVEAVELGRTSRDAQRGRLLGIDSAAVLEVLFAVSLPPDQAAEAWVRAHGERYGFGVPPVGSGGQVFGAADGVGVQLQFGSRPVLVVGEPRDYRPVPPGSSVVTIVVSGEQD